MSEAAQVWYETQADVVGVLVQHEKPMRKVALVTGAARRIGRSIAEHLARDGYCVAVHYRNAEDEARQLADRITDAGGTAAAFRAELTDPQATTSLIDDVNAALGPVACLVNNASVFEADSVESLSVEIWERHFATNLQVPVFLASLFAKQLPPDRTGCIVNMIDQRVWRLTPNFFSYTLSKAALWTATTTLAQSLAPRIRVNAVGPGPTFPSSRQTEADFELQSTALPLQTRASPAEVAEAVCFLARSESITGQMIAVDGGQHIAWKTPDVVGVTE